MDVSRCRLILDYLDAPHPADKMATLAFPAMIPAFAQIYNRRTCVERSINALKDTLGISNRKTSNVLTTKADLFLAGIVQLLCVLLAYKLHNLKLARCPRKLIA